MASEVDLDDFWVAYQPIVDLDDGTVVAVETLLRSSHDHRPGAPAELVAKAESDGTIHELGRAVLRRACEDAAIWSSTARQHGATPPRIMVNLSALQLQDVPFVDVVVQILRHTGFAPDQLEFELTESQRLTDTGVMNLAALAHVGVGVSLDDFGTGFGSLNDLRTLPLTGVKIDRRFVGGLPQALDVAFVKAIKDLADARSLWCIAEGVETELQHQTLRDIGVKHGQGFGLSRPLDAERVTAFLQVHAKPAGEAWSLPDASGQMPSHTPGSLRDRHTG